MIDIKKFIDYLKLFSYSLIYLIIISLILSIIYYFTKINYKTISNIILFMILIWFFFLGFKNGKKSKSKGYLAGLKIALIFISILLLFNLIFLRIFKLSLIFYYLLLILSSILGGMLGINRKKD